MFVDLVSGAEVVTGSVIQVHMEDPPEPMVSFVGSDPPSGYVCT